MGLGWHPIYEMKKMFQTTNQLSESEGSIAGVVAPDLVYN